MNSDLPDELGGSERDRLGEAVSRALYFQRLDEAEQAVLKLEEVAPNSTTTWELRGDALLAQGNLAEASEAFQKALELEPANADAERKYAALQLDLSQAQREREMLESGDLEQFRGAVQKEPGAAAVRSAFFPGLGQVYKGEYEKGVAMFVAAFVLLIPAVRLVVTWLPTFLVTGVSSEQTISTLGAVFGYIGLFGFLGLYIYGVYDAYRSSEPSAGQQTPVAPPIKAPRADDAGDPKAD